MPEQEYDLFLSYATEDREWETMLAERLHSSSVRVWFDFWKLITKSGRWLKVMPNKTKIGSPAH